MNLHLKPVVCLVSGCSKSFSANKGMIRHLWAAHSAWAERNNMPNIGGTCADCGERFRRKDNAKRHKDEGRCKRHRDLV